MHSSILFASTFLAALTASAPTSTATGTVTLQLGVSVSGDDSETRNINFGQLVTGTTAGLPPASSIVVGDGEGVLPGGKTVSAEEVVCQAFSDAAGKVKLGSTFNDVLPGIKLSSTQLVTIGSVFCSDAAGVAAFSASTSTSSSSSSTSSASASTSTAQATIQIEFDGDEGAAQGTVPVNGVLTPTQGRFASPDANSAYITTVTGADAGNVKCEAFGDANGKQRLGTLLGSGETAYFDSTGKDVPLGAFKCSTK